MTLASAIVLVVGFGLIAAMAIMLVRARKLPLKPVVYSRWQDRPVWLRILVIITVLNFLAFLLVGETHGGTAWNGYRRDGHYFLGEGGAYTEAPRDLWMYSYYHALTVSLCFVAVFIGAAFDITRKSSSKV
jgi:hypothetical protein